MKPELVELGGEADKCTNWRFVTLFFSVTDRIARQKKNPSKNKEDWITVNHLDFITFVEDYPLQLQNVHLFSET